MATAIINIRKNSQVLSLYDIVTLVSGVSLFLYGSRAVPKPFNSRFQNVIVINPSYLE